MKKRIIFILLLFVCLNSLADNGHQLWLRYTPQHNQVTAPQGGPTLHLAVQELQHNWCGHPLTLKLIPNGNIPPDGYEFHTNILQASTETGLLYGAYALLREQTIKNEAGNFNLSSAPRFHYRLLNHWDNLDGTIERGYAGHSIFWNTSLPYRIWSRRLKEYARANASIGINGSVLDNVNASPKILTTTYLDSVRLIANILRPYGIKVYLSVNFGTPKALGSTVTADPLDPNVITWWNHKAKEIYQLIPDFGGFVIKANSEGQPGPFDYGRSHSEGTNMIARALAPYGGVVFWRSFVYGASHKGEDRVMQAVNEFKDQDGKFLPNVILQSKNGPLDFQPREPYAPIFDNIKFTRQLAEFQITQEYLGQSKHLVYLAPMWKEFFHFVSPSILQGIGGVANIGDDTNWCGHPFSQANWYAFGRLAWDPDLSSEQIAREWIKQTFTSNPKFTRPVLRIMLDSREACVNYMEPLGLHHIMSFDHHYGPEPDGYKAEYPIEWCPVYYHKADSIGLGFERSSKGTNATSQYREPYRSLYDNLSTCPPQYLLWFHHVAWNYKFKDGTTLWQQLCRHYNRGVNTVAGWEKTWLQMKPYIDAYRWQHVNHLLHVQFDNAKEWRKVCLLYFQTFSHKPIK